MIVESRQRPALSATLLPQQQRFEDPRRGKLEPPRGAASSRGTEKSLAAMM
jgi:hypothetical protein